MMMIEDRMKRINLKSKRKKTLLKKVIEFSGLFKLDILLVIQDNEMNKVIEYNSGAMTQGTLFTLEEATKSIQQARKKSKIHKYITDDNYNKYL